MCRLSVLHAKIPNPNPVTKSFYSRPLANTSCIKQAGVLTTAVKTVISHPASSVPQIFLNSPNGSILFPKISPCGSLLCTQLIHSPYHTKNENEIRMETNRKRVTAQGCNLSSIASHPYILSTTLPQSLGSWETCRSSHTWPPVTLQCPYKSSQSSNTPTLHIQLRGWCTSCTLPDQPSVLHVALPTKSHQEHASDCSISPLPKGEVAKPLPTCYTCYSAVSYLPPDYHTTF